MIGKPGNNGPANIVNALRIAVNQIDVSGKPAGILAGKGQKIHFLFRLAEGVEIMNIPAR